VNIDKTRSPTLEERRYLIQSMIDDLETLCNESLKRMKAATDTKVIMAELPIVVEYTKAIQQYETMLNDTMRQIAQHARHADAHEESR
jgi:hypothetical protein